MFWKGRVNAVLFFITVGLAGWMAYMGEWMGFFGTFFFMLLVRGLLGLLNLAVTAVTGTPLFYDTKLLDKRRRDRDA